MKQEWPGGLPIGGGWAETADTSPVIFPYDGSEVAAAPLGTPELAARALDAALGVAPAMAALPSHARRAALTGARDALRDRREEFERLLVLETGKPLVDCRVEVDRTLVTLESAAEEVARLHGETVPLDLLPSGEGLIGFWTRRPIGVVVGITGFNYPLLLAAHKIAPAVAAGCPVIVKPAPATPLATLWLVHLLRESGLPPEAVQLVTGDVEVGKRLVEDRRIGAVSFTGSAAAGHAIARAAAPTKVLLELGSNAALVVAADADLEAAADAVVRGGYYASGQACISVQRVLVEEAAAEAFTALVAERVKGVEVGDPRLPGTRVAPLIDQAATDRVLGWIAASGAEVVTGGHREGRSIAPTVLAGVPDGAAAWDEEIFGPVVCVRPVPSLEAAFDAVNASRYGLHAAVYTRSLATAFAAIERIEAGGVVVNEVPGFRADNMPYGGVKDSGAGREGPRFAIEELTVTRMAIIRP
ncbi:aldehyde dehydrogenase family protein [Nonomuraea sp. NPDC049419]|uniref:aldehyde dehydrogenase family protein n=1 Tax=Nonomuraea sp. NPDC049419 TaxID=3155772 RepID=UPI0034379312